MSRLGRARAAFGVALAIGAIALVAADAASLAPDSWSPVNVVPVASAGATATTLQDGRVLVAGGATNAPAVLDGSPVFEVYDPATDAWSVPGTMNDARALQTATLLPDGDVLVAGGDDASGTPQDTAELFNPVSDTFAPTPLMTSPHAGASAVLLADGDVLIAGGDGVGGTPTTAVDIYDPAANTFTMGPPLGTARALAVAAPLAGGRALVAGGETSPTSDTPTAEVFTPAATTPVSGTWSPTASPMSAARLGAAGAVLPDGDVLVIGGASIPSGGGAPTILASTEIYDPAGGDFTQGPTMATPRYLFSATALAGGVVLVAGGAIDTSATPTATSELLDPATGAWTPGPAMSTPRVDQAATLLSDGDVLELGGGSAVTSGQISTLTPAAEMYAPPSPPSAPASVTASAGNASAAVLWAPSGADPLQITHYVVTSSPDGIVVTTPDARTGVVVPGLRNGVSYTFTVAAVNAIGTGPPSAPSTAVTPAAPSSGAGTSTTTTAITATQTTTTTVTQTTTTTAGASTAATAPPAPRITLSGLPRRVSVTSLLKGVRLRVTTIPASALAVTILAHTSSARISSAFDLTLAAASAGGATTRTITLHPARRLVGSATRFTVEVVVTATDAAGGRAVKTAQIAVAPAKPVRTRG